MIILTLRTDKPEAEIALYKDENLISEIKWQAHRALADTIHFKINEILKSNELANHDIEGIVCYKGPGSFTGLRIGLTVVNTFAASFDIPIVGVNSDNWENDGIRRLLKGENDKIALPLYGAEAKTTKPKK